MCQRRPRRVVLTALAVVLAASACSYRTRSVLPRLGPSAQSSTLVAADGTVVHTFHAEENRRIVGLAQIPEIVRDAVLAIEDERFYRHNGVDLRAIARAIRSNTEQGSIEEGGSTITQQYVKIALLRDDSRTLERKIEEASLALQLERQLSKDRILELYLNAVYFGNGAYGVETAARQYFDRSIGEVSLAQAALLAGLIQRPGATDPYDAPDAARARRDVVLERMRDRGTAPDEAIDAALAEPLALGSSTVPAAERYAAAYFVEEVKQWILDDPRFGSSAQARRDLLFGGGLRIQTTLDLRAQAAAEDAMGAVLPNATDPDVSIVAIEPGTGYVRAMVGGRDFFGSGTAAKLNLATQGHRPAGSSLKPIVLAQALEEGMSPRRTYDAPGCIRIRLPNEVWDPCNYAESGAGGAVNLIEGTVRSVNTLYAQLVMDVGPQDVLDLAHALGVRSRLDPVPSIALGSGSGDGGVTALDLASAYATFANRGVRVPPILVTRITRADGTVLFRHRHTQERVLDVDVADTVTSILEQAVARGTGTAARLDRPVAGKTGTADDHRDAWFAGYTPDLATAVWVGFHRRQIPMEPPTTRINVTGGSYPAQIWRRFMAVALDGVPVTAFPEAPALGGGRGTSPTTSTSVDAEDPLPTVVPRRPSDRTTTTRRGGDAIVRVPDVVGRHGIEAAIVLDGAGFDVRRRSVAANVRSGTVVAQNPPAGSLAPAGSSVRIDIAE